MSRFPNVALARDTYLAVWHRVTPQGLESVPVRHHVPILDSDLGIGAAIDSEGGLRDGMRGMSVRGMSEDGSLVLTEIDGVSA